jgi:NDP-sugar pyrophosphorylase family protein
MTKKTEHKKYVLLETPTNRFGRIVYRIKAVRRVNWLVPKGRIGGYVESENNLSHHGECWIDGNAAAIESARVSHNAELVCNATAMGQARISGSAKLLDDVIVKDRARVGGKTWILHGARIEGDAIVRDAIVSGRPRVGGKMRVRGGHLHAG